MAVEAAVKPKALEIAYGPFVDWVDRTTVTISWDVDEAMSRSCALVDAGREIGRFIR